MVEIYDMLRRMTGTVDSQDEFTDDDLQDILDFSVVHDDEGRDPEDEEWQPSYDLNRAASLVWAQRAANIARVAFDSQIDMTKAERNQIFDNFSFMSRFYRMRSRPTKISAYSFEGVRLNV